MQRLIVFLLALSLSAPVPAQSFESGGPTFPSKSWFNQLWTAPPYEVEIESVGLLENYVSDGVLRLSLNAYLELVMANHPDVNLQKLSVYEQQNAIQRALSPFDPDAQVSFNATRSTTPSNDLLQGADVRSSLNQFGRAVYNQVFDTGTQFQSNWTSQRSSNNSAFQTFNPAITQTWGFQLTQPLLRGRGRGIQRLPFLIAESRLGQTEEQVRQQVIQIMFQAENDYWDVIQARENLIVQQNNLDLARAFLERSRRELELGAISALDIFQPEQQFATAQVGVTQAQYTLQQAEDGVRRQIGADLFPEFRELPLELTESANPPENPPTFEKEDSVAMALNLRPEIRQQRAAVSIDDLQIKQAANQLRPDLSINASYQSTGRGGDFFDRSLTGDNGMAGMVVPGGLSDALSQLFGFDFPTYQVGLSLQLPLRNRRAAADLSDATIQKKRDIYQIRSLEQDIRLDVVQAIAGLERSKAAVQQAAVARDFAQKRLDAEQKKYDLGVNTAFIVLDAQDDLVRSEADLLAQSIAYRRALLQVYLSTGDLLEQRGVSIRYDGP